MRWIPLVILAWVMILLQTTVVQVLTFQRLAIGTVGPDLLACFAVFLALYVPRQIDVLLAAWVLGIMLDLASAGGPGGASVVGPMAIAYVLAAMVVFSARDIFFRDRAFTRVVLTLVFCLIAHVFWVTLQSVLAWRREGWDQYGRMLLQAGALAAYSAAISAVLIPLLTRGRRWLIRVRSGREDRRA